MNVKKLGIRLANYFAMAAWLFFVGDMVCWAGPQTPQVEPIKDPYEKFNRAMFNLNEKLDKYIVKPIAELYNLLTPKPLNEGIHNFFNNIDTLPIIANDILQLRFYETANDMWRVAINTTFGIGGLFDVASRMQLRRHENDFGMTLAQWGYKNSNYIVWPFYGPSTVRDGLSVPIDYIPSVYPYIPSNAITYGLFGMSVIDKRANLLQYQPVFDAAAVDKYVFIRNAYMQRRAYQIKRNEEGSFRSEGMNRMVS